MLLKQTLAEWKEDDASRHAAALAFYTAISITPLLVMVVVLVGLLGGTEREARTQMFSFALYFMGPQAAEFLDMVVKNADKPVSGGVTGLVSLLTLVWGSTNVFIHLQTALNRIWGVANVETGGLFQTIRSRLLSFALVFVLAYLLLVSLVLSTVLTAWMDRVGGALPSFEAIWGAVELLVSFVLFTLLFAGVFKIVPDTPIAWRDVWLGAAVTSLFFSIGKFALTYYLGNMDSSYGAAGSLVAFLLWVYYSAQILFFGAEFTQVYSRRSHKDVGEGPVSSEQEPVGAATPASGISQGTLSVAGTLPVPARQEAPQPASVSRTAISLPVEENSMNNDEIRSILSKAAESLADAVERSKSSAQASVDEATAAGEEGVQALKHKAGAALSDAERKAAELAEEAQRKVAAKAEEAKGLAQDQVAQRKQMIGERLEQVADILHSTGKELRSNNEEQLGAYAETAAKFFDQAASRFKTQKKRGVMGFLQEHPEVVAVAILAVSGYLGKRYLSGSRQ